jgi:aryl-alcohol dehydrogenase-like predicted oxidoreductase
VDGPGDPFDLAYIDEKFCGSLDRLGVDAVEILMTHAPDAETPIEETLEALETIRASGRCRHVGGCNLDADGLSEALDAAQRLGIVGYEVVQNEYNLLAVDDEAATRLICAELGVAFMPYSPLAGGVLTGKYARDKEPAPNSRLALRPEAAGLLNETTHSAIDELRECAANKYNVECGALALAWVARHPDVTSPVVGPSRLSPHLSLTKQALDVDLTATDFFEITRLFSTKTHPD